MARERRGKGGGGTVGTATDYLSGALLRWMELEYIKILSLEIETIHDGTMESLSRCSRCRIAKSLQIVNLRARMKTHFNIVHLLWKDSVDEDKSRTDVMRP